MTDDAKLAYTARHGIIEQVALPSTNSEGSAYGFRCHGCGHYEMYYEDKALFFSAANWDYCPRCGRKATDE